MTEDEERMVFIALNLYMQQSNYSAGLEVVKLFHEMSTAHKN